MGGGRLCGWWVVVCWVVSGEWCSWVGCVGGGWWVDMTGGSHHWPCRPCSSASGRVRASHLHVDTACHAWCSMCPSVVCVRTAPQAVSAALQRVLPEYVYADEEIADPYDPHADANFNATGPWCTQDGEDDPCEPAVVCGGIDRLQGVAAESVSVDAVSATSKTALFMAAANGKQASVRMMLVCSADHTLLSKRKKNALYAAVEGGAWARVWWGACVGVCVCVCVRARCCYATPLLLCRDPPPVWFFLRHPAVDVAHPCCAHPLVCPAVCAD